MARSRQSTDGSRLRAACAPVSIRRGKFPMRAVGYSQPTPLSGDPAAGRSHLRSPRAGQAMPLPASNRPSRAAAVRIVVVDDDPAIREMIVNFFVENDMHALGAPSRQAMISHVTT